ncbi:uncharacterized protein [Palaemon carinicauda]|uniref:uncharacterized protein isoform X1 n=2 Tax=Palaemon carinicauda TaxID=392227 RepID=UPI0035B582BD
MEGRITELLLIRHVEDISEKWVKLLLKHRADIPGMSSPPKAITLRHWSRGQCPSQDKLAGFSSTRATVRVEYEVESEAVGQVGKRRVFKETFVVKVVPTIGNMANLLIAEGMHHIEVGQYDNFLRTLSLWEQDRRRSSRIEGRTKWTKGVVGDIIPDHALAISTEDYFTLVMPDLRHLGYQTKFLEEGLSDAEVLIIAETIGRFHGTVVAYKLVTQLDLQKTFPKCFHVADVESPMFSYFPKAGFERLRQEWCDKPHRATLLELLMPYEQQAASLVVENLLPREPFATAIHGDVQPTNIFFKTTSDGKYNIKLIDWALARYSQGTYDLIYLLSIGVEPEVRRRVSRQARDIYFKTFNTALTDLDAGITYPREQFEKDMVISEHLSVIWSISSINLLFSSPSLQRRLTCIIKDVVLNPNLPPLRSISNNV